MSDTINAAKKIQSLLEEIENDHTYGNGKIVRNFVLALAIEKLAEDSIRLRVKLHNKFANYLIYSGITETALEHAKIALSLAKKIQAANNDEIYNCTAKIANIYYAAAQNDSAKHYFKAAISEAEKLGNYLWMASGWNNIGYFFMQLSEHDSARLCFSEALEILELNSNHDSILLKSIYDNLAQIAIEGKDFYKAMKYYEKNLVLTSLINDTSSYLQAIYGIVNLFLHQNKLSMCISRLNEAEKILRSYQGPRSLERKQQLQYLWLEYYEKTKNFRAAFEKHKWLKNTEDSLNRLQKEFIKEVVLALAESEKSNILIRAQLSETQLKQKQNELYTAKRETLRNKIVFFAVTILAALIIVLGYFYWRNRSKVQQQQIELSRAKLKLNQTLLEKEHLEKEKTERELKLKKGDLSDLAIYLGNLKKLNNILLEKLSDAKKSNLKELKELAKEVNTEIGAQMQTNKRLQLLYENVDSVNKEFYLKLQEQFPELTKSESELCGLIRLNLSNKEIGELKNISPESVKKARQRMRKKLHLSPETDIYHFLSQL